MDIRKIISEEIKKIGENYPLGVAQDSSAPWNQEDPRIRQGETSDMVKYDIAWYRDNAGVMLFKDAAGNLYALSTEGIEDEALEPYANREEISAGQDEEGFAQYDYGDIEINADVFKNYINSNLDTIVVGKGFDAYEDGHLSLVDDEVKKELMGLAEFLIKKSDAEAGKELAGVLQGGLNETIDEGIANDQYIQKASKYFDNMLIYLQRIEYATGSNPDFSPEKKVEVMGIVNSMRDSVKNHIKMMMDAAIPDNELAEMNMADKLVHQDRMMTPTGTLFFMSAMEESIEKIKELIHECKKNHTRRS